MRQRRITPTTILTDAEVHTVALKVRAALGSAFSGLVKSHGLELEEGIRFMPVAKRCEECRCARGLNLKSVAAQLGVPQYRLKDVEAGNVRQVRPEVLHAYLSHLELASWYRTWARMNVELARRLELPPKSRSSKKVGDDPERANEAGRRK